MLFSLPDNDAWSHKNGPHAQVTSIAAADRQLERLMHAAGGPEPFLEQYAVIVTSDHSQAPVEDRIRLDKAFAEFDVATQSAARSAGAEVALSPAQRSAMIYALDPEQRDSVVGRSLDAVAELEGVDLVLWLADPDSSEAAIRSARGELRFSPGGDLVDGRGASWSVEGDLGDDPSRGPGWTAAVHRVPRCARSRMVCAPLSDVGRRAPVGRPRVRVRGLGRRRSRRRRQPRSMHRSDSLGALLWCGTGPDSRKAREQWSLRDVAPMVRSHFGIGASNGSGAEDVAD